MNWIVRKYLLIMGCGILAACASVPVPEAQLNRARTAVSVAEAVGAEDVPKAKLFLKLAKDNVARAERYIQEEENERALHALQRAEADAQLAAAQAQETADSEEARRARKKVTELRARLTEK